MYAPLLGCFLLLARWTPVPLSSRLFPLTYWLNALVCVPLLLVSFSYWLARWTHVGVCVRPSPWLHLLTGAMVVCVCVCAPSSDTSYFWMNARVSLNQYFMFESQDGALSRIWNGPFLYPGLRMFFVRRYRPSRSLLPELWCLFWSQFLLMRYFLSSSGFFIIDIENEPWVNLILNKSGK